MANRVAKKVGKWVEVETGPPARKVRRRLAEQAEDSTEEATRAEDAAVADRWRGAEAKVGMTPG